MSRFVAIALLLMVADPRAQAPPAVPDVRPFEVASVKQSPPPDPNSMMVRPGSPDPGGRWSARNSTLLMILQRAYPEFDKPGMIVGGPGWLNERRFDIDARAEPAPTRDQYPLMVRLLLADRFKLKVRVEPRRVEVYSLIVARADGRLGPRLRPATPECLAELDAERARLAKRTGPVTFSSSDTQPCTGANALSGSGMLRLAGARTLESLAFALQVYTNKRVVDRTGLAGIYEFDLEFDYAASRGIGASPDSDTAGGSVFTAVQEHLGLKLDPRRETMGVLVIDSVDMPSEN
jgi:uncharacterized protein (TIGR03435 family)